jgi:short-subunit dehydrogenase
MWKSILLLAVTYKLHKYLNRGKVKKEKVVIVGASSGIGKELALLYAKRGCELLLVARRQELLDKLKQECLAYTSKVDYFTADINVESQISDLADYSKEYLGKIDLLVISSGILSVSTFDQLCDGNLSESALSLFNTNVLGPILLAKYFKPLLLKGKLCVISSLSAYFGAPTRSLYTMSKFALRGFFESLRIEWKSLGISIILINPATVNTNFRSNSIDSTNSNLVSKGLDPIKVATIISQANDSRSRSVFIPNYYYYVVILSNFIPNMIDYFASRKYKF